MTTLEEMTSRLTPLIGAPEQRVVHRYLQVLPESEAIPLFAWFSTFLPYQLRWLLESAKHAINLTSRQVGKSHTTGGFGVIRGAFHGELTTIVSVGQMESDEVFDKCEGHIELLRSFGSKLAVPLRKTASSIKFSSRGRVLSLPSTGGRGFTGNVFLDEFAYHKDPEKVIDRALAVTTKRGVVRICSTPNGVGNLFHKAVKGAVPYAEFEPYRTSKDRGTRAKWALHRTTIHDAIADGYEAYPDELLEKCLGDIRLFGQLYECKFLDGVFQYIPDAAINSCAVDNCYTHDGEYYAGLDIGLNNDLTALVIVADNGTKTVVRAILWCKRTDEESIYRLVDYAVKKYRVRRVCVDSTGLGTFPAKNLRKQHGHSKIEPVVFTMKSKEDLVTTLWWYFVNEQLWIPKTDKSIKDIQPGGAERLQNDVASLQRIITPSGNVRFDAPATPEGHADLAWALALALHAAASPRAKKTTYVDGQSRAA